MSALIPQAVGRKVISEEEREREKGHREWQNEESVSDDLEG